MANDPVLVALQRVDDAEKALLIALVAQLPRGETVYWMHGEHEQKGEVVDHSRHCAEVRVENVRTKKRKWLSAHDIIIHRYGHDWRDRR